MVAITNDYGREWPEEYSQATIELRMYLESYQATDTENAIFHFSNAAKLLIPESVYTWSYWTDRSIRAFIEEEFITNWGGGGTGKSTTYAMILIVDWLADPLGTTVKIYTTDLGKQALRLFGEIMRIHDRSGNLPGMIRGAQYDLVFKNKDGIVEKNAGVYALSVTNRAGRVQKVSTFGVHNQRNRLVIDEMQGTPEAAFDSIDNFVQGGKDFKFIGIGNPETWDDLLGQYSRPKGDYTEFTVQMAEDKDDQWDTYINGERLGVCLWFDGLKSPRILDPEGEKKYSFLQGKKGNDLVKKLRGENSPQWWNQVRGFIQPGFENTLSVINRRTIDLLRADRTLPWENKTKTIASFDPGYTKWGDPGIVVIGRVGRVPGGKLCLQVEETRRVEVDEHKETLPVSYQLANQVNTICQLYGVDRHGLACDTSATQTGPADILRREHHFYVERISYAKSASGISWDPAEPGKAARELYGNMISELYHLCASMIEHGHLHGISEKMVQQLVSRRTYYKNTRLHLEDKEDFRSRMKESPNEADALVQLCWLFLKRWKVRIGSGDILVKAPSAMVDEKEKVMAEAFMQPTFEVDSDNGTGLFGV